MPRDLIIEYLLVLLLESAGKFHRLLLLVEESVAFSHLIFEVVLHFEKLLPTPSSAESPTLLGVGRRITCTICRSVCWWVLKAVRHHAQGH